MNAVEQQISRYEEAVNALERVSDVQLPAATLSTLIARDKVALALADDDSVASPNAINRLETNDRRLAALAIRIDSVAGFKMLASWRHSRNSEDRAWWWKLDELAAADRTWSNRAWTLLALLCFTASIAMLADTFNLLRTIGANPVTTLGTLTQAALAFIAGSAFTEAGRKWLVEKFSQMGIGNRRFKGWERGVLALAILFLTCSTWLFVPALAATYFRHQGDKFVNEATYFQHQGNSFIADGLSQRAFAAYQQAVALEPRSIETHLALAQASEKTRDAGKAIEEYKSALALTEESGALNDSYYFAKTRFARLLITHDKSYSAALPLLTDVLDNISRVSPLQRKLQIYYVLTYLGWAHLELGSPEQARGELQGALVALDRAEAHYLLGRTLEGLKNDAEARNHWVAFLRILQTDASQVDDIPPEWIGEAQEKLMKGN